MSTPFEQILEITLTSVQKLLADPRIGQDTASPNYDEAADQPYKDSQFNHIYGDVAYEGTAGNNNISRRPYTGDTSETAPFYPLTMQETLDLQSVRILDYLQLGFVPIDDLEKYEAPSLFIANATDRQRIEPGDTTLNQVQEVIPLNFRLMTKQPDDHTVSTINIVVVDKVLEGLKYVLNEDDYTNLTFERRGYDQDTVIRKIEFVQSLNLEEFLSPYEVVDYLFRITVREQRSRSKGL